MIRPGPYLPTYLNQFLKRNSSELLKVHLENVVISLHDIFFEKKSILFQIRELEGRQKSRSGIFIFPKRQTLQA